MGKGQEISELLDALKGADKPSQQPSKKKRRGLDQESIQQLLQHLVRALEYEEEDLAKLPEKELKESESWLDWGLNLVKEWGPKVLSMVAPALLAL